MQIVPSHSDQGQETVRTCSQAFGRRRSGRRRVARRGSSRHVRARARAPRARAPPHPRPTRSHRARRQRGATRPRAGRSARERERLARSCAQRWPHEWSRAHAEGMRLAALASPVNDCACALRADYLFCERLYKPLTTQSWCPAPHGYPQHCCYATALADSGSGTAAALGNASAAALTLRAPARRGARARSPRAQEDL